MKKILSLLAIVSISISTINPIINMEFRNDNSKNLVDNKIKEINKALSDKDISKLKELLIESNSFAFKIYTLEELSNYENEIYQVIYFLKNNEIDIKNEQYKFESSIKEYRDFAIQESNIQNSIVNNSINTYKYTTKELYFAKNLYFNNIIGEEMNKYAGANVEFNRLISNNQTINVKIENNNKITNSITQYQNALDLLSNFFNSWSGGLFKQWQLLQTFGDDFDENKIISSYFKNIKFNFFDILFSKYSDFIDDMMINKMIKNMKNQWDDHFNKSPEWIDFGPNDDMSIENILKLTEKRMDYIIAHNSKGMTNTLEESIANIFFEVTPLFYGGIADLVQPLTDFSIWAEGIVAEAIPEIKEKFNKFGLTAGKEKLVQVQQLNNGFDTVIDFTKEIVSAISQIVDKEGVNYFDSLAFAFDAEWELNDFNRNMDKMDKMLKKNALEMKIIMSTFEEITKIPNDISDSGTAALKENVQLKIDLNKNNDELTKLSNILKDDKTSVYMNALDLWNEKFKNNYYEYLNINIQSFKVDEILYYNRMIEIYNKEATRTLFYLNYYNKNVNNQFNSDLEIINNINQYIKGGL